MLVVHAVAGLAIVLAFTLLDHAVVLPPDAVEEGHLVVVPVVEAGLGEQHGLGALLVQELELVPANLCKVFGLQLLVALNTISIHGQKLVLLVSTKGTEGDFSKVKVVLSS